MAHGVDLNALKELEREAVLQVLYRDREVQNVEEQRVRKLKAHLQRLRWEGAKSSSQEHREKSCARCQRVLGLLLNRGAVCRGCSHRVCRDCRVFPRRTRTWKCTVCFEDRNVKIKTGEWFFEERAKKFPTEGKHQTAGARLLQSYQKLSKISVVPPTPPPLSESQCSRSPSRLQELGQFKGFNKSMENLFLSVTTHMKKLSKSQSDVTSEKHLLATGSWQCANRTERRSQSDTAVNVTTRKASTPDILKSFNQEVPKCSPSPVLKQDNLTSSPAPSTSFSEGLRRGSLISINSTCTEMGNFENANVSGEIEFAIRYCFKTHSLEICIKACKNLAYGEERKKKCNPYVKTYLLPDRSSQGKRKTTVQKNTVDPTFQETLKVLAGYTPTCRSSRPLGTRPRRAPRALQAVKHKRTLRVAPALSISGELVECKFQPLYRESADVAGLANGFRLMISQEMVIDNLAAFLSQAADRVFKNWFVLLNFYDYQRSTRKQGPLKIKLLSGNQQLA